MRILGVDPGLVVTGYGVIQASREGLSVVEAGVVRGGPQEQPLEGRLGAIYQGVLEVLDRFFPDAMALEELYSHYAHPTTAILMGHARGVICLAATQKGVPVFSYSNTQIKMSVVGEGGATKEQVQKMVRSRLGKLSGPYDVTDALAAALCHYSVVNSPLAHLPKSPKVLTPKP
ncbi:MAG: crossover junction endodeoxyribonuclease RuvC [Chloroflexi bacterium]|nr:crossover junction endodeoxyribonuclease RuvC [Chloroflexota bacterium]